MDYALRSVLIVDDTPDIRELLAVQVEMMGLETVTASNGRQALELMNKRPFDMILLDIMMPEVNGYQVLEAMSIEPRLRHIPVIVISALGELESVVRCIELGAEDYLIKPFNTIMLRARLEASLEKKRLRDLEQTYMKAVHSEQEGSEELLYNVLPTAIAERLKLGEKTIVDRFENVTVLFSDIVGFLHATAQMSPEDVVHLLNKIYTEFDDITKQHGLEKIKTIGDMYMLAGGVPIRRADHATAVAAAALAMQRCVRDMTFPNGLPIQLRTGIDSGPVVAGVIGRTKLSYDLWGSPVNNAIRIEESCSPGKIHISKNTMSFVKNYFVCQENDPINVEGTGAFKVYSLMGYKKI